MRESLFRPQAMHASQTSLFGERVFYQPLALKFMLGFLGVVLFATLAFAAFAPLTQTERVRGFVTSAMGEIKVYSPRSGVLLQIHVQEGDLVAHGDLLATLIDPGADAEGTLASDSLLLHVDRQIDQLLEQIGLLAEQTAQQREQLAAQLGALATESELLWEEHEVVRQRLAIAEQEYLGNLALFRREAISRHEHNQAQVAWFAMQQQEKSSQLNAANRSAAWQDVRIQLDMLPTAEAQERLQLEAALTQLRQRRDELRMQGRFTITAPVEGVVGHLVSVVGDPIEPRVPFVTVMPPEHFLEARLYLPSRSMAEIATGQRVLLSYDAYPSQRYGLFEATLESLAPVPIDPREYLLPFELYEPVYLARARLASQKVRHPGSSQEYPLRSGMLLQADIVTGTQTLLRRITGPLTTLRSRL